MNKGAKGQKSKRTKKITRNRRKKLSKRAQILFDEQTWDRLSLLADLRETTVARLVREAVEQTYRLSDRRRQIQLAHDGILKHRKVIKGINYKELINDGRKY